MKHRFKQCIAVVIGSAASGAGVAAESARFAAPGAATPVAASSASGIGQVTLALLLVIAAVFVVAWLARRLRNVGAGGANGIEVLAQTALGAKERAVIVRVGRARLLLGVAAGQVNLLYTLPEGEVDTVSPAGEPVVARPGFAELLKKSLGR